jgi:hypothetical protein
VGEILEVKEWTINMTCGRCDEWLLKSYCFEANRLWFSLGRVEELMDKGYM